MNSGFLPIVVAPAGVATLGSPGDAARSRTAQHPTVSIAHQRPSRTGSCAAWPAQPHPLHHERHRPEQTTLHRVLQQ
ncbi:MAG: hypothetical protein WCT47_00955 [Betaproteobacteria bacterium]